MKKLLVAVVVVAGLAWLAVRFMGADGSAGPDPVAAASTTRSVDGGELVGFIDARHGASAWLGIPFAAPTNGGLRWRAPAPPLAWQGTLQTLRPGPMCPQIASLLSGAGVESDGNVTGQEDCLYLNVWAPPNAAKRPVMLWIHGGGNSIGHGGSYNGARLATAEDVVVITINYRLGVFGWFSHPALMRGDPADDSGNYGTLDIIRALEWTRDNIEVFGGDPNNITLFGESAGARDTLAMIASPLAKGLFHRAIVQSGGFGVTQLDRARAYESEGGHPNSSAEVVVQLLVSIGRAPDAETARAIAEDLPAAEIKALLYSASVDDIFSMFDGGSFGMIDLPDNYADGYVLPKLSNADIFGDPNNHNMVPTILGTNRDEPSLFMVRDPRYVENFLWIFPRLKDEAQYLRTVKYGALAWKERGVDSIAEHMTQAGNPNVYAYRFDWDELPSILGYDLSVALGAAHGLEISFVFGEFEGGLGLGYLYNDSPNKDLLARSMMGYWAEFARHGQPGSGRGSDPNWTGWGVGGQRAMLLDTPPAGIRMTDDMITKDALVAALDSDAEIATQRERCEHYVRAFRFEGFDPKVYAELGEGGCAAFDAQQLARF